MFGGVDVCSFVECCCCFQINGRTLGVRLDEGANASKMFKAEQQQGNTGGVFGGGSGMSGGMMMPTGSGGVMSSGMQGKECGSFVSASYFHICCHRLSAVCCRL